MLDHWKRKVLMIGVFLLFLVCGPAFAAEGTAEDTKAPAASTDKPRNPVYTIKTGMGNIEVELFADKAPETVANFIGLAEGSKPFTDPKTDKQVKRPFYDGLIFHRVIKNFMIQGGCPLGTGTGGPGYRFADEIDAAGLGLDGTTAVDEKGRPHPALMIRSRPDFQRYIMGPLFDKMGIKSQADLDRRKREVQEAMVRITVKEVLENIGYRYTPKGSPYPAKRGVLAMANSGPGTNGSQFFINLVDTDWLTGRHTVFGRVVGGMDVVDKIGSVAVDQKSKPKEDVVIISIRKKTQGP